jgi:hypothetical protein
MRRAMMLGQPRKRLENFRRNRQRANTPLPAETRVLPKLRLVPKSTPDHREPQISCLPAAQAAPENRSGIVGWRG